MIWTAQYGIIAQQLLSSMLRSGTVAGMSPLEGAMPMEGLMLQGTYALIACSYVHRVRICPGYPQIFCWDGLRSAACSPADLHSSAGDTPRSGAGFGVVGG